MPASGRVLLDTNVVIALLAGDEALLTKLDQASEVFIPAIVLGELFYGARSRAGLPRTRARWSDSHPADPFSRAMSTLLVSMDGSGSNFE